MLSEKLEELKQKRSSESLSTIMILNADAIIRAVRLAEDIEALAVQREGLFISRHEAGFYVSFDYSGPYTATNIYEAVRKAAAAARKGG